MPSSLLLRFACLLLLPLAAFAAPPDLRTHAEKTDFIETGRYEEVERLSRDFVAAYPKNVRAVTFGTTPEGRPMLALVASADGVLDAKTAREKKRPVFLFQGGIHAGEIDGKDAGFLALRHWLDGTVPNPPLGRVTVVFVPVFNIDGHERFGPNNRPNQRGPAAMGWRTTGQNLNLNRDYTKAEAPEMQAMLRLLGEWDPIAYADLHVTDGSKFRHDIAVMIEPTRVGPEALRAAGARLSEQLMADLTAAGSQPLPYYPEFDVAEYPPSGFSAGISSPRFSQGYWGRRNRLGILVETHSWHTYRERTMATYHFLLATAARAAQDGAAWLQAAAQADAAAAGGALAGRPLALEWKVTKEERMVEFLGYEYARVPSEISGRLWTRYDESKPQVWRIPLRDKLETKLEIPAPAGGWIIHAAHAKWVAEKLDLHGITYRPAQFTRNPGRLEVFRASEVIFGAQPVESRPPPTVTGEWKPEEREIPAGSIFVPVKQARAELAMHLLEPRAPDSLVAWGFLNAVFEQKEGMDAYVAEEAAREMLQHDPRLRAEFEAKLAADPAFAASPGQRLNFFYERHPSHDERLSLVPIFRVPAPPR